MKYESVCDAAKTLGLSFSAIGLVCNGKCKRVGEYNFRWMPIPEPLPGEVWKPYKKGCQVSNMGRVKTKRGWIYTPWPTRGVVYAQFCDTKFHIVVCKMFVGPPPSKSHTVDHIDRDPTNNKASNLRWATKSEQVLNRDLPALGDGFKDSLKKSVRVVYPDGTIQRFLGISEAARQLELLRETLGARIKYKYVIKGVKYEYDTD